MNIIKLKYKEKEITFSLGLYFVGEIQFVYDMDIEKVVNSLDKNPLKFLPEFMYYSAKTHKELNGEAFEMTKGQMISLISEDGGINSKNSIAFLEAFNNSLIKNVPETDEKIEENEKK